MVPILLALAAPAFADCRALGPGEPVTLVLALDGVPPAVVERAREQGAFRGWGGTRPLVSTFPSMTNVGFAAILAPFGAKPNAGYELRRYDPDDNRVTTKRYADGRAAFDWSTKFQVGPRNLFDKARMFVGSRSGTRRELERVERFVLESDAPLLLAYVGSTDPLVHFRGLEKSAEALLEVSSRLDALRAAYAERRGRPLRVVLLSDHGNHFSKVRASGGMLRVLRDAGLRPGKRLAHQRDVVAVTYGVVGYTALFLDPAFAEVAARATLAQPGVHLAAWIAAPGEIRVVSLGGDARVRWRDDAGPRRVAYEPGTGDPLRLGAAVDAMAADGTLDHQGYAPIDDWFERTAAFDYPDAAVRLVESLTGAQVSHAATVIVSFEPGRAWGLRTARVGAWLLGGGALEATHGGLDRESTWGFLLVSDAEPNEARPVRADRALARWGDQWACDQAAVLAPGNPGLHGGRVAAP